MLYHMDVFAIIFQSWVSEYLFAYLNKLKCAIKIQIQQTLETLASRVS